jgi:hypothetical protein
MRLRLISCCWNPDWMRFHLIGCCSNHWFWVIVSTGMLDRLWLPSLARLWLPSLADELVAMSRHTTMCSNVESERAQVGQFSWAIRFVELINSIFYFKFQVSSVTEIKKLTCHGHFSQVKITFSLCLSVLVL